MGRGDPFIHLSGVSKAFGQHQVLNGVDLSIKTGEVVCIIGPSGGGKSTLLRCMNGLELPDKGTVRAGDVTIPAKEELRRRGRHAANGRIRSVQTEVGMVFQQFNLFPHMTAAQNVAAGPLYVKNQSKASALAAAKDLLHRVGLGGKAGSYPDELSGGQQQRVAIARALAMEPRAMLFDEVTSALDPELVGEVLDVMRGLAAGGMTMAVVTHEMAFARQVGDRVVFVADGRVLEEGPPAQVFDAPEHERTKAFVGAILQHQ